jgi:transcriptional regulator with XRE-family HTH domain
MANAAGELIRARRQAHGLSQRRLALRAGTSQAAIAAIESGRRSPTVETLERLLMALGEELDLEGAIRPSRWRDHDEDARRAFARLSMEERLQAAIDNAPLAVALQGAASR